MYMLCFLSLVLVFTPISGQVGILNSTRADVQLVVDQVEATCIFPANNLYLRRVAFVETADGNDPSLVLEDEHYGGIWKISEINFNETQTNSAMLENSLYIARMEADLDIRWPDVAYEELTTDPFLSALACMLYTLLNDPNDIIPVDISDQATYWVNNYNALGNPDRYIAYAQALDPYCVQTLDLVFLVDESDSVLEDQEVIRNYMQEAVAALTIGEDAAHVGIMKVANNETTVELSLAEGTSKSVVLNTIRFLEFNGGASSLAKGLHDVREIMFQEPDARPVSVFNQRTNVLITDGNIEDPEEAQLQSDLNEEAGINTFVGGVAGTDGTDIEALAALASEPVCRNLDDIREIPTDQFYIESFSRRRCLSPQVFVDCCQTIPLPNGLTDFLLAFGNLGASVTMRPETSSVTMLLNDSDFPNIFDFDFSLAADPDLFASEYISPTNFTEDRNFMFGAFQAEDDTNLFVCFHPLVVQEITV